MAPTKQLTTPDPIFAGHNVVLVTPLLQRQILRVTCTLMPVRLNQATHKEIPGWRMLVNPASIQVDSHGARSIQTQQAQQQLVIHSSQKPQALPTMKQALSASLQRAGQAL